VILRLRNYQVFRDLFQILIIGLFRIFRNYKTQNWASFAGPYIEVHKGITVFIDYGYPSKNRQGYFEEIKYMVFFSQT